jgi:hypothetical protein
MCDIPENLRPVSHLLELDLFRPHFQSRINLEMANGDDEKDTTESSVVILCYVCIGIPNGLCISSLFASYERMDAHLEMCVSRLRHKISLVNSIPVLTIIV